eukprot:scaffold77811_cov32-Phaeocystis_antarctica.AAC.1
MPAVHEVRVSAGKQRPPTRLLTASASLTTRPPPCTRSYLGSCSSGNDELARPSRAADDAARSERVCRCPRQSRVFTLDEAGGK